MRHALLACLFSLALAGGCGSDLDAFDANARGPYVVSLHGPAEVRYPIYWHADERQLLERSVSRHLESFSELEGVEPVACTIAVIDTLVHWNGATYAGMCEEDRPRILVFAGVSLDATVLYHELAHLHFARRDTRHLEPRWPVWNQRNADCVVALDAERGPELCNQIDAQETRRIAAMAAGSPWTW